MELSKVDGSLEGALDGILEDVYIGIYDGTTNIVSFIFLYL